MPAADKQHYKKHICGRPPHQLDYTSERATTNTRTGALGFLMRFRCVQMFGRHLIWHLRKIYERHKHHDERVHKYGEVPRGKRKCEGKDSYRNACIHRHDVRFLPYKLRLAEATKEIDEDSGQQKIKQMKSHPEGRDKNRTKNRK